MLGEQFMVGEEICGAVVSVRFQVKPTIEKCLCFMQSRTADFILRYALSAFHL